MRCLREETPFRLSIPMQSAAVARLLHAVSNQISLTMNDPGMREHGKSIGGTLMFFFYVPPMEIDGPTNAVESNNCRVTGHLPSLSDRPLQVSHENSSGNDKRLLHRRDLLARNQKGKT